MSRRKQYEESMMVRLSVPKHQKSSRKRGLMSMSNQLSGIARFGDITALTGGDGAQVGSQRTNQVFPLHILFTFYFYSVQDASNSRPKKKKLMKKKTKRKGEALWIHDDCKR